MFLVPHPRIIDFVKGISSGQSDPGITARDFVPMIEAYRNNVAPVLHHSAGVMRATAEFTRTIMQACGVSSLFTASMNEVCGWHALVQLMTDPRIQKPGWALDDVTIQGRAARVEIEEVTSEDFKHGEYDYTAFMGMKHFKAIDKATGEPIPTFGAPVELIAPHSGHPPEYLDKTVQGYLEQGRDVYIVYCRDAMDIPVSAGRFGLNEYISGLARFTNFFRDSGVHVIPVCQPGPPLIAALALMGELINQGHKGITLPLSAILKANPFDTEVNPQVPNIFAKSKNLEWFKKYTQAEVPKGYGYKGEGREIYYGPWQIVSFMMGKPDAHWRAMEDYRRAVADGHHSAEHKIGNFYGDRFLVPSSLTWEFYKETVNEWFLKNSLARETFRFTGEICGHLFNDHRVDVGQINSDKMGVLYVEGQKDDITGVGQVTALSRLLTGVKHQFHILVKGAGHTGVFRGDNFITHVCKPVVEFINAFEKAPTTPIPKLNPPPRKMGMGFGQAA